MSKLKVICKKEIVGRKAGEEIGKRGESGRQ